MIETAAARELVNRLRDIEDRLHRLLVSGWRQAEAEAADLRHDAVALAEAGLTEVAARVAAVADAGTAAEALPAIALAASACRRLRPRLLAAEVPDGWAPLAPSKSRARANVDVLLPVARMLLEGREVWACVRPTGTQWLLLEPPFPAETVELTEATDTAPFGIFGRLRQQIGQVSGDSTTPTSPWLARPIQGRLVWQARYPLGADGQVTLCTIESPEWLPRSDDLDRLAPFQQMLANAKMQSGAYVVSYSGGLRVMEPKRSEVESYAWLDPTAASLCAAALAATAWAIVWQDGASVTPVALVEPSSPGSPARLTHLIPGLPSDLLAVQA
jgi:hypothetical protein